MAAPERAGTESPGGVSADNLTLVDSHGLILRKLHALQTDLEYDVRTVDSIIIIDHAETIAGLSRFSNPPRFIQYKIAKEQPAMRKSFIFIIMSSVLVFIVPGCALSVSDKPAPEEQYAFTQDSTGQLVQADVDSLDGFSPTQTFDHSLASKSEPAVLGGEPVPACFGSCNSTSCSCVGDFDCCLAGCSICIIMAN